MAKRIVIPAHQDIQLIKAQTDIGLQVKAARTSSGLRIDTAAALCGVSVALLSALESGNSREIGASKILQILDGLGLAMVITYKEKAYEFEKEAEHVAGT